MRYPPQQYGKRPRDKVQVVYDRDTRQYVVVHYGEVSEGPPDAVRLLVKMRRALPSK
jgi:hypothetical protein